MGLIYFHLVVLFQLSQEQVSLLLLFDIEHHELNELIWAGYSYLGILPIDVKQQNAEIGNFNEGLHYAIIKLDINLFDIMVRKNQVLALILAIILRYIFKINTAFLFFKHDIVLLFIVLQFRFANTGICFQFDQNFQKQIPCSYCLHTLSQCLDWIHPTELPGKNLTCKTTPRWKKFEFLTSPMRIT